MPAPRGNRNAAGKINLRESHMPGIRSLAPGASKPFLSKCKPSQLFLPPNPSTNFMRKPYHPHSIRILRPHHARVFSTFSLLPGRENVEKTPQEMPVWDADDMKMPWLSHAASFSGFHHAPCLLPITNCLKQAIHSQPTLP